MSNAHFNVFRIRFPVYKLFYGEKIFSVNLAWLRMFYDISKF